MPDAPRLRLAAQHVAKPALAKPGDVVARMGAMQAQDLPAALWAVGLRTKNPRVSRVHEALERGTILRTWPMRGTLHLVAAQDARWMVALLAPRALARAAGRRRELGITEATLEKARAVLVRALEKEGALSRPGAYAVLDKAGIRTAGQRGIHVLGHLAQEGTLCVGPHQGKQPTFALLDVWAGEGWRPGSRDEALAELARRYVESHGPATAADLAWWAGLTVADARAALSAAGAAVRETPEGWIAAKPRRARETSPAAHLLPAFDEYAVAYKDRSAALARVGPIANAQVGLLSPCILVDGQMVGTWGRSSKGDRVRVALKPLVRWSAAEREAVEADAQRYADFLGVALDLETRAPSGRLPDRMTTRAG